MTHDQVREMVRRVNPIPDPKMLEIVDVPVLTTPLERRTDMQTDNREVTEDRNRRRGPLVGIAAAAAVILIAGLVFYLTRDARPWPSRPRIRSPLSTWSLSQSTRVPISPTPTQTKQRHLAGRS